LPETKVKSIWAVPQSATKRSRKRMFEIDFLPVEAGEKSGDAIAFRTWRGNYFWVFVLDGGYADSGDALVEHINYYTARTL